MMEVDAVKSRDIMDEALWREAAFNAPSKVRRTCKLLVLEALLTDFKNPQNALSPDAARRLYLVQLEVALKHFDDDDLVELFPKLIPLVRAEDEALIAQLKKLFDFLTTPGFQSMFMIRFLKNTPSTLVLTAFETIFDAGKQSVHAGVVILSKLAHHCPTGLCAISQDVLRFVEHLRTKVFSVEGHIFLDMLIADISTILFGDAAFPNSVSLTLLNLAILLAQNPDGSEGRKAAIKPKVPKRDTSLFPRITTGLEAAKKPYVRGFRKMKKPDIRKKKVLLPRVFPLYNSFVMTAITSIVGRKPQSLDFSKPSTVSTVLQRAAHAKQDDISITIGAFAFGLQQWTAAFGNGIMAYFPANVYDMSVSGFEAVWSNFKTYPQKFDLNLLYAPYCIPANPSTSINCSIESTVAVIKNTSNLTRLLDPNYFSVLHGVDLSNLWNYLLNALLVSSEFGIVLQLIDMQPDKLVSNTAGMIASMAIGKLPDALNYTNNLLLSFQTSGPLIKDVYIPNMFRAIDRDSLTPYTALIQIHITMLLAFGNFASKTINEKLIDFVIANGLVLSQLLGREHDDTAMVKCIGTFIERRGKLMFPNLLDFISMESIYIPLFGLENVKWLIKGDSTEQVPSIKEAFFEKPDHSSKVACVQAFMKRHEELYKDLCADFKI